MKKLKNQNIEAQKEELAKLNEEKNRMYIKISSFYDMMGEKRDKEQLLAEVKALNKENHKLKASIQ